MDQELNYKDKTKRKYKAWKYNLNAHVRINFYSKNY